jgi:hypothetical protein
MEDIFSVDAQATQLRAVHLLGVGDSARLVAIAVQGKTAQLGGRNVYGVPFEDDRGLGSVAAAKEGCRGCALAKGAEYLRLELVEGSRSVCLGLDVARNVNVDYAPGRDVWRQ